MTNYEQWVARQMRDPAFREAYEALEPAYQISVLRHRRGLTQAELAEHIGSSQSSVARVEAGTSRPTLDLLQRVAKALDARLVVQLVPREDVPEAATAQAEVQAKA